MIGERILRAGAAVVAGFVCAWEHLRTPLDTYPAWATAGCPVCGESLDAGPHRHDPIVVWRTDHDGSVLLTNLDGAGAVVFVEDTA